MRYSTKNRDSRRGEFGMSYSTKNGDTLLGMSRISKYKIRIKIPDMKEYLAFMNRKDVKIKQKIKK